MTLPTAARNEYKNDVSFLSVLADGLFHLEVPEGTEGGKWREFEDRKTKEVKRKFEVTFDSVEGNFTCFTMKDQDYGLMLYVGVGDVVISLGAGSPFGEDFLKKLPNIDFKKPVTIRPYSFPKENNPEKMVKGLTIYQDSVKLASYYYDVENKKTINGLPEPEKKLDKKTKKEVEYSTDDWKIYFLTVRKFLVEEAEKFVFEPAKAEPATRPTYDTAEADARVGPDGIPF